MRRPKFKALLWLVLVIAAYCAGRLHGRYEFDWALHENADQYKKDLARRDKVLREVVAENLELRDRLGLPQSPAAGHARRTPSE